MNDATPPGRLLTMSTHHPHRRPLVSGTHGTPLAPGDDVFFAAVEFTRTPIVLSDPRQPDNPVVFANRAFLAMTGYAAEEVIGRNCRFLQGVDTDRAVVDEIRAAIADRRDFATEILNYRKDGYAFWNALSLSPVFGQDGELVYFFSSQLDVTRRREAEDNLRHSQKMEALGQLTGGVAHDFNNLLQVMVGYLELIDTGLAKPQPDASKLRRNIGNARAAADRAAALTQQLLSYSRKQRLEGRAVNLNVLIRGLEAFGGRALGSDVAFELHLAENLANCRLDATQIEIALLNIIISARDAMRTREHKRLVIETRNIEVERGGLGRAKSLPQGSYVSVEIADSGTGVPSAVVERLMDPFFTSKEEGQGTGLGLSMVYGFAKQFGGAAWISSIEDVGTTVCMVFPAFAGPLPESSTILGIALDRPGDETILIVEDRQDVREMARAILGDQGYCVLGAHDGRTGIAVLESRSDIDLLFTETVLPDGTSGVEMAREARRRNDHLKVLLTTGFAEASAERIGMGGRDFDILNKPYGRVDLLRKVRAILDEPTGVS